VSDDLWIIVPKWDKFQHYTDRDPLWIKVYTELGSNPDFCDLTAASRGVLLTVWVEFARSRGQLKLSRVLDQIPNKGLTKSLESLSDAGFILLSAIKPLALTRSREKKERREDSAENTNTRKSEKQKPVDERVFARPDKVCPDCGETLGQGHLETCPRMPKLADDLLEETRQ
jgi:hypothetical protein